MEKKNQKGAEGVGRRGRWRENLFYFLFFFVSFSDLRKSDSRFLSGLKVKLIYATRATRGYQILGVSSNSTRWRIFLLVLFLA